MAGMTDPALASTLTDMPVEIRIADDKTCAIYVWDHHDATIKGLSPEQATAAKHALLSAFRSGRQIGARAASRAADEIATLAYEKAFGR